MYERPEIHAMAGYVPGEQPKRNGTVKLNTNENPYRASEKAYDAIREICDSRNNASGLSRYPNPPAQPFREAAAEIYGVEPETVLCGNGSDDILTILTRTFVGSGELIRLPRPSYILYASLAEIQGARYEEILFDENWRLPPAFAEAKDGLKLVFLPNPNSPSGTVLSKGTILEIAERLPCPLIVDEAYADFSEFHCIDLVSQRENIIVTRTLSKAYALAGLRFGYLFAPPNLVEQMLKVKDSYNCDALSIAAATAAICDTEWQQENRRTILATRKRLTEGMRTLGFAVPDSQANFIWCVHPSLKTASHKPIYEYLKQNGYLVRYMNYGVSGDGLRISVGTDEQIDECLALIRQFVSTEISSGTSLT
ncbi:MAG: histidinol-phosphate transaminase [Planctomycetaceae bacterium]|jgi:histidinol-phosphate aminotransferase|nr:histidinol-phosphate transaminase [Planctomycetaceae bacterium]